MTYTDRHIIEAYAGILEGLNPVSKKQLIDSLTKSLTTDKATKVKKFYKSFGAFTSNKEAVKIIADIRVSRKFKKKEIKF